MRYRFTSPTPETQKTNIKKREGNLNFTLRDVLGWNVTFRRSQIDAELFNLLYPHDLLTAHEGSFKSKVRCSTVGNQLYFHSSYPTEDKASVFFGPDTYRFIRFVKSRIGFHRRIVDLGCGCGVGGLQVANHCKILTFADINKNALAFARINAQIAEIDEIEILNSDLLESVGGEVDCIISNPPFMIDPEARVYRDGGGNFGADLSRRIVAASVDRLAPNGSLHLYTASAVVDGLPILQDLLSKDLAFFKGRWDYEEIDPDIFGEELQKPAYQNVERLAAVGISLTMPSFPVHANERAGTRDQE